MTNADRGKVTFRTVIAMSNAARAAKGQPKRAQERISNAVEMAQFEPIQDDPSVVATPKGYRGSYPISSIGDFAQRAPPEWFVKGVIPMADLGVVFGPPGSGKSFFVLDLALSIARGIGWRGHRSRAGRVLYLAAEGGGGVALRLRAYAEHHGVEAAAIPCFGLMDSQPNFLVEEDISEVVAAITAAGGVDLVIVDTFAQVTPGANENGAEDMGKALRHCRSIREATGAMVLLVHHSGKDASRGARGWSGLRGAADVEIEVRRDEDERCAKVTKLKDGEDGREFYFALREVQLGVDGDGDAITSVIVEPLDPGPRQLGRSLGSTQKAALDALDDCHNLTDGAVELDMVLARMLDLIPHDAGGDPSKPIRDRRRSNFKRTLENLVREGVIHQSGTLLSLQPIAVNDDQESWF